MHAQQWGAIYDILFAEPPPMGVHSVSVIPVSLEPFPRPHPSAKPGLLPGLWLEHIGDSFAAVTSRLRKNSLGAPELHLLTLVSY